jgi:hypothetical protein
MRLQVRQPWTGESSIQQRLPKEALDFVFAFCVWTILYFLFSSNCKIYMSLLTEHPPWLPDLLGPPGQAGKLSRASATMVQTAMIDYTRTFLRGNREEKPAV